MRTPEKFRNRSKPANYSAGDEAVKFFPVILWARYDEGMDSEFKRVGWVGQAVIVGFGSLVGVLFASLLFPTPMSHGDAAGHAVVWAWVVMSCGAIAGGLLFSWIKDR